MDSFQMECEEKLKTLRNWNKVELTPEPSLAVRQVKNGITVNKTEIDIDEVVEALKMYYIELIKVEQRRK
ncbi:hypothetical protein [Cetobacterium sp.]|uniref:hypothetical protein n=1 Tax=Cetobacterium sp. TaxID=2071632 RepID=UPI003EE7E153